jgi:hypothetical protein
MTMRRQHRIEQSFQIALVKLIELNLAPGWFFFHVPNGGKRSRTEAGIFKAMGVKAGVDDLIFIQRGGLVYLLELKRPDGSRTKAQREFHFWCQANDVPSEIASDIEEAIEIVTDWGALRRHIRFAA